MIHDPRNPEHRKAFGPRRRSRRDFIQRLLCAPALVSYAPRAHRLLELPPPPPLTPPLLNFDEIAQLYTYDIPPAALRHKLHRLLTTAFVSNQAWEVGVRPAQPTVPSLGPVLRVAQWNINRGLAFEAIRLALTDEKGFTALLEKEHSHTAPALRMRVAEQFATLQAADLIVLNEVDWGVNRTHFRNVAAELAAALQMNYAYGVEFVECDPGTMGLDRRHLDLELPQACIMPGETRREALGRLRAALEPDPARYRGLQGTAILSRYRLLNPRVIRFRTQGYDWYHDEKRSGLTQRMESLLLRVTFDEPLCRQVRRGGRMMLLVDIEASSLPSGRVTVAATHLEDAAGPESRRQQIGELLATVKTVPNPVIVAGDMNTTMHLGMPVTLTRSIRQLISSPTFWTEEGLSQVIEKVTPWGWAYSYAERLASLVHQSNNPTSVNIPLLLDNPEEKFFRVLENFRFDDGSCFDFRGDSRRSANGRDGKLANSNERGERGFIPTQELPRTYGPMGQFKIDWIFVRPGALNEPCDTQQSYLFSPHYGRTLRELNHCLSGPISDHSPITADLPLNCPPQDTNMPERG